VTISEIDGVRDLHLDTPWVQGAMHLRKPRTVVLEYVQRMLAWMLWRPQEQLTRGHAVQLGLGAAVITRFTQRTLHMRTTAVELNPAVIAASRRWFRLGPDDAQLSVVCADAASWLRSAQAPRGEVSALCVDLYDHEAAAPVLDDEQFYADCRALLSPDGVMSVNLFGRQASFERSMARIAAAFGPGRLWHLKPTREGNAIAVATHAPSVADRHIWRARADNIEARYRLPARKWLRLIQPWQDPPDNPR